MDVPLIDRGGRKFSKLLPTRVPDGQRSFARETREVKEFTRLANVPNLPEEAELLKKHRSRCAKFRQNDLLFLRSSTQLLP
ncbi:hypothetical protein [Bradyrhizobium sp. 144]|uniref:hypothetical protein n=1 Tax=Bradyrhizobium sp. 144 TaxID=2782620 RepID=UPI001FFB059C|nr:hypothetical protein [Bradyrhizobium sp. 144]MCK1692459.1 hypothetical protein [Bradyrhizobium sp. 144]